MPDNSTLIEDITIQPVAEDRRKGKASHLFPVWFGVNIMPLTLVTGVLGPTVFGLPAAWSVLAMIIGNLLGAILMALHSVQGARLGVPQMIQSRAQFGMYGALLVLAVGMFVYVGFLASILILARDTLGEFLTGLGGAGGLIICTAITLVVVIVGYELFHRINRVLVYLFGLAVVVLAISLISHAGDSSGAASSLAFTGTGFMGMISTAAVWQIAYAPYVSDYSRYLPTATSSRSAFWYTYVGCVAGALPMMVLGALLVTVTSGSGTMADLVSLLPTVLRAFVLVMLFLGAIDAAVINLYGPSLTVLTIIQTFKTSWVPRSSARAVAAVGVAVITLFVGLGFGSDFLNSYVGFIYFLALLLIPWSIINLIDYYVVKKGEYDVRAFVDASRGYGHVNVPAVAAYILTFLIEVPFASTPFYTGPIATALNGADLTWVIGSAASIILYLGFLRIASPRVRTEPSERVAA